MRFLITWTTYGCWLPGDPRGFRTRGAKEFVPPPARYSDVEPYEPEKYKRLYERSLSETQKTILLNESQKQIAADAITEVCSKFVSGAVIAVTKNHAHVFVDLPCNVTVEYFCGRVKSVSSLKLSDYGLKGRVWARKYHAKPIPDESADEVRNYVRSHENQDAVVVEFMKPRA
jgi:REP element-mobilizing transposase RayT